MKFMPQLRGDPAGFVSLPEPEQRRRVGERGA